MAWDFETEPEFQVKLDWMRTFMKEEVWPLEVLVDQLPGDRFWALVGRLQAEVKRSGLWATHLPPELGGQGMGQLKLGLMHEIEGSSFWGPMVFGNNAPDTGNAEVLALFGTPKQKEQWLYPLLDKKIYSGFSMSEPENAGSDPVNLSTTAILDGDEWVINGHKWFTTNGLVASFLIVMVVTDPEAGPFERASMLLVPTDTRGVDLARNIPTMGDPEPFGFGHAEVYYRDVRVPRADLIGKRGEGFKIAQHRLGPGRIHHCMRWLGQSQRAFDIMCERALQREAFGGPLASKQTIQNFIADSAAEMEAARLMTLHAAWKMDRFGQQAARQEISMIKFFGAAVLHNVIDRAIQTCGGLGYSGDLPLEAMYRHARAARIYDGVDEVHRQTVARLVLKNYEKPPGLFPSDHLPTRRAAARERFADLIEGE
ncbi:MAG: acyl-CoA dehydrogenase family protein [Candidatus Dormibacteraeota bacterium]|uniref:Acyl-CoA dehydrogenase family protein n=1 Tax=Candidatus Dormiibacter inghamiae TaxID=3127013 RepID=A0A934KET5_9BACT|nr:acyl-CoA dehydrogenase family protein [Candidatus Dormibacteraeota bacterium]MBJ7606751.1 acyl-CoA dehydrogenase family protein [Candidatus Dormibacteraeota bacterium]